MNNPTIAEVLTFPDAKQLPSLGGRVIEIYKQRAVKGDKTVQDVKLSDATGEIKLAVWDHPDLKGHYENKEIMILAGNKGGLVVKLDTYNNRNTNTVSVSRTCTFQVVQVGAPAQGSTQPAKVVGVAQAPHSPVIRGEKVGMAINNAVAFMTAAGEPFSAKRLALIASDIIRVSKWLEDGNLVGKGAETAKEAPVETPPAPAPAASEDMDVPY